MLLNVYISLEKPGASVKRTPKNQAPISIPPNTLSQDISYFTCVFFISDVDFFELNFFHIKKLTVADANMQFS